LFSTAVKAPAQGAGPSTVALLEVMVQVVAPAPAGGVTVQVGELSLVGDAGPPVMVGVAGGVRSRV
jgi:hypothetical protein